MPFKILHMHMHRLQLIKKRMVSLNFNEIQFNSLFYEHAVEFRGVFFWSNLHC